MIQDFLRSKIPGYDAVDLDNDLVEYIKKYWIDREQLIQAWAWIIESRFVRSTTGIVSVAAGYSTEVRCGGLIFEENECLDFRSDAKRNGSQEFAVIEDVGQTEWNSVRNFGFFRFVYPIDVSWNEMTRSSGVAEDVFGRPIRCFFVVTSDGEFGKYVNNDADMPYEVVFRAP